MKTTLKTSAALLTLSLALSTGAASAAPVVTSLNTGKTPQAAGISTIAAANTFTIELNGSVLTEQGFQPSAAKEPLVPLRAVAEALGFSLTWNQSSKTAEVTKGNIFTSVKSGENRYTVNKMSTTLGAAPQTLENKLFVPASFVSEVLQQTVSVEGQKIVIASAMTENGVITAINADAKFPSIQIKGTGTSGLVLNLSEDTVLLKADGTKLTVADLQIGMTIEAEHALFSTRSLPPQTPAYQITVLDSAQPEGLLGTEGTVESINTSQDGALLIRINGTGLTETSQSEIVLRLPADAAIVNESGEPAMADAIVQGAKVIGFYGPMLTRSLPAIGTAWKIVVIPAQQQ